MKTLYVTHEYLLKRAAHLRHSEDSNIDGLACFSECGCRYILINERLYKHPIKLFTLIRHEIVHHILDWLQAKPVHDLLDYLEYGWRIKEGKWVY